MRPRHLSLEPSALTRAKFKQNTGQFPALRSTAGIVRRVLRKLLRGESATRAAALFECLLRVQRPCVCRYRRRIESQIEADTENVAREADRLGHSREDVEHPRVPEIDMEVLEFDRQVLGNQRFDTRAGGPSGEKTCPSTPCE
jgi:hypothetical protein